MFDTKFYKNRWRPLNFRRISFSYFFFIVTSNYENSMYPRSFLCEEAKIKQRNPLRVGSIPTLHLKTFEQLFWTTTCRKNSRKAQWQTQSRYLCHCAFLVSFRYAGSEKTWPNHFISISLALVTLPVVLRR